MVVAGGASSEGRWKIDWSIGMDVGCLLCGVGITTIYFISWERLLGKLKSFPDYFIIYLLDYKDLQLLELGV